jgi:hypothetical protein
VHYLLLLLTNLTAKAFGLMATTLAPSGTCATSSRRQTFLDWRVGLAGVVATAITPVVLVMMMLFAGYLNPKGAARRVAAVVAVAHTQPCRLHSHRLVRQRAVLATVALTSPSLRRRWMNTISFMTYSIKGKAHRHGTRL